MPNSSPFHFPPKCYTAPMTYFPKPFTRENIRKHIARELTGIERRRDGRLLKRDVGIIAEEAYRQNLITQEELTSISELIDNDNKTRVRFKLTPEREYLLSRIICFAPDFATGTIDEMDVQKIPSHPFHDIPSVNPTSKDPRTVAVDMDDYWYTHSFFVKPKIQVPIDDLEVIPENVYAEIRKGIIEKDNETMWEKGYLGI